MSFAPSEPRGKEEKADIRTHIEVYSDGDWYKMWTPEAQLGPLG